MLSRAIWMLLAAGCASGDKDSRGDSGSTGPTFYQDVLPLVGENCQGCHNSAAPMGQAFPLETYEHVNPLAELLLAKMQVDGDPDDAPYFMPPIYARSSDECTPPLPWKGVYAASEAEIDLFGAWIDAGKPAGDPDEPAPYARPTVPGLDDATDTVGFKGSFEVPSPDTGTYDTFRCFALEQSDGTIAATSDRWISGYEFEAGNTKVVHHVLIYAVSGLEAQLAGGLAEDTENNSWECSGGVSRSDGSFTVGGYTLIYGWVPGSLPLDLGSSMAMRVSDGTGLVAQVHYNTLSAASSNADRTDLSTLKIRTAEEPAREARIRLFGVTGASDSDQVDNPPFLVPMGSEGHVESYTEQLPVALDAIDLRIWGFVPHMHLTGTEIKMSRIRTDGTEDCLIHVPRWDFNWQQFYVYDGGFKDLPQLHGDEELKVTCTLDNTDDNPFLQEYLGGAVAEGVTLGETTEDEMCLVALGLACEGLCPDGI